MRRLAWGLVLGLVLSIPAVAGVGVWTPAGGLEPPFSRLLADPADPETLYALVLGREPEGASALWRTTDGGATWVSIQNGLPPVDLLAVDPLQPGRLYAWDESDYSQPKLWVSEDRGATWTLRYAPVPNTSGPYFWQIVASPLRRGVLYGWTNTPPDGPPFGAAIYRSADGGATWTPRGLVGTSRTSLESLSHHPVRNQLEYFDNAAFFTSVDNGLTWTVRGTYRGQGFRYVTRSAAAPDRLYALPSNSSPCLLRSDDGGTSWKKTRSFPGFPGRLTCTGLAVDPHDPDLIRVTADGLIGRRLVQLLSTSRDGGTTWSRPRPFPTRFPVSAGGDPATLFAAGGNSYAAPGPYKSTDDGQTWTASWKGIAAYDLRGGLVALPASGPDPLLLSILHEPGFVGGPLVRSVDGGVSWEMPELSRQYWHFQADADGRTLYGLRFDINRLEKSVDGGRTWVDATPRAPIFLGRILADPFQPGRVFASAFDPDRDTQVPVWRTADGGRSWARRSAGLPVRCTHFASTDICPGLYAVTSDPGNPDRVLIAYGGADFFSADPHIYLSLDGGKRWQLVAQSPPEDVLSLAADPAAPGVFLAGTLKGIYRSEDGGNHWTQAQPGLPVEAPVWQLLRDSHTGAWYAVTDGRGIFRSTDGGSTWASISAGVPDFGRPVVVVDPQTPGRLFAAFRGQGVWSWSAPGS